MRKIFLAVMFVIALTVTQTCEAKDVWVEHRQSENIDIYVMDDTITSGSDSSGRYFKVSTKFVKNGQLQRIVNWSFGQVLYKGKYDSWRCETNTMRGSHTSIVFRSPLFEFCMNQLGWSYEKFNNGYYR